MMYLWDMLSYLKVNTSIVSSKMAKKVLVWKLTAVKNCFFFDEVGVSIMIHSSFFINGF